MEIGHSLMVTRERREPKPLQLSRVHFTASLATLHSYERLE